MELMADSNVVRNFAEDRTDDSKVVENLVTSLVIRCAVTCKSSDNFQCWVRHSTRVHESATLCIHFAGVHFRGSQEKSQKALRNLYTGESSRMHVKSYSHERTPFSVVCIKKIRFRRLSPNFSQMLF